MSVTSAERRAMRRALLCELRVQRRWRRWKKQHPNASAWDAQRKTILTFAVTHAAIVDGRKFLEMLNK